MHPHTPSDPLRHGGTAVTALERRISELEQIATSQGRELRIWFERIVQLQAEWDSLRARHQVLSRSWQQSKPSSKASDDGSGDPASVSLLLPGPEEAVLFSVKRPRLIESRIVPDSLGQSVGRGAADRSTLPSDLGGSRGGPAASAGRFPRSSGRATPRPVTHQRVDDRLVANRNLY